MIFNSFATVQIFLKPGNYSHIAMFTSGCGLMHNILFALLIIYHGDCTTKEAEASIGLLGKLISKTDVSVIEKVDFVYLMAEIRSRNLNIENIFFKINLKILLTVKLALIIQT